MSENKKPRRPLPPPPPPMRRKPSKKEMKKLARRHKKNISGAKRYKNYLERDKYKAYLQGKIDEAELKKLLEREEQLYDGEESSAASRMEFGKELDDSENPYLLAEKHSKNEHRRSVILRSALSSFLCLASAVGLNFLSFHFPFTPSIIKIDFSAFPELLAGLAVNPIAGVAVIIVKSLLCYLIRPASIPSIPNKLILDTLFMLLTVLFFRLLVNSKSAVKRQGKEIKEKDYSASGIVLSGLAGSFVTALISLITLHRVYFPLLFRLFGDKGYSEEAIFRNYLSAFNGVLRLLPFLKKLIPTLSSLFMGTVMFNLPLNMFKYFVCAAAAAVIFTPVYEFIHKE